MYYKDIKKEKKKVGDNKPSLVRVTVWENSHTVCPKSTLDAEWPEYNKEKDRIRHNTIKYKGVPISEAMCNIKLDEARVPELPIDPVIGSVHSVILKRAKNGDVYVTGLSTKESVVCKNNLSKYKNFDFDNLEIDAVITNYNKAQQVITVDIIKPIFDKWIKETTDDLTTQYDIVSPRIVAVEQLKLCSGGFIGKAKVPCISEFFGEPYYVDAFIPGSQIVLNIENDFSKWEGKTVNTFVAAYNKVNIDRPALICSRKDLLNFYGNIEKINIYKAYCEDNDTWKKLKDDVIPGIITGVINSNKKCGVFVELPTYNITGIINCAPDELVNYKNGSPINVKITDFEQMLEYDDTMATVKHLEPYVVENNKLKRCILKPILSLASFN